MLSRRRFVATGGAIAAGAALGCDRVPDLLDWTADEPFTGPDAESADDVVHVFDRLTFGRRPGDYGRVRALASAPREAAQRFIEQQLAFERVDDARLERALAGFGFLNQAPGELYEYKPDVLRAALASATILRATYSERHLYEVLVHFWTDHFNIDIGKGDCRWLKAADDRLVIRPYAMGGFRELVRASATSPAMLWYLDGRVNQRATPAEVPNENHARELLELHTLGVDGGYTQHDVMETARALTGWTVRSRGESYFQLGKVEFQPELHDDGRKVILGHEIPAGGGAGDVDSVIDILVRHPATARHIARKLCRRFIADDPPQAAVRAVADTFSGTSGSIRHTLRTLFSREEFWTARSTRLKRPFHFVVSALRTTDARTDAGAGLQQYLLRLGQAPFQYPTPDGYPDEAAPWLGTLLWRWSFAKALGANEIPGTRVDAEQLSRRAGGDAALIAHCLGRRPTAGEVAECRASGAGLALALAAPDFQRF